MPGYTRKKSGEGFAFYDPDGNWQEWDSAHSFFANDYSKNTVGWWTLNVGGPILQLNGNSEGDIHGERSWLKESNKSWWDKRSTTVETLKDLEALKGLQDVHAEGVEGLFSPHPYQPDHLDFNPTQALQSQH